MKTIFAFAAASFTATAAAETMTPVCDGWRFHRGDVVGAESVSFDAKGWKPVSIPHDWAISGPFHRTNDLQNARVLQDGQVDPLAISGRTGALPWVGVGWYRGTFTVPDGAGFAALKFDGAMACAHMNGTANKDQQAQTSVDRIEYIGCCRMM